MPHSPIPPQVLHLAGPVVSVGVLGLLNASGQGSRPSLDRGGPLRGGLLVGRCVLLAVVLSDFARTPAFMKPLGTKFTESAFHALR